MAKLTLSDLTNLQNETSAVATMNENSAAIETALENTLSRDGTSPNTMGANLDMNDNRIFNLPEPIDNTEPLRVIDAVDLAGLTVTPDTGASILAKLLLVDGTGSLLDADLLDGVNGTGYVKYADKLDLQLNDLDLGESGNGGILDIFPTTAASGRIKIFATASAGDFTTNITNASQAAARIYTIPDAGTDASFVMTAGAQTIAGAKTFSAAGVFSSTLEVTGVLTGTSSILSTSASAGIGYGTGAGGTVVQATSKSTTVALNKTTGTITMNNAALAAAAEVTFTLTNTAIAATDMVFVHHVSAGTAGAYMVQCSLVAAGSVSITVTNQSAGSLGEAIVLRFIVLKSVDA